VLPEDSFEPKELEQLLFHGGYGPDRTATYMDGFRAPGTPDVWSQPPSRRCSPLRVDDRLGDVVVRDRRVVLLRQGQLDVRQVVQAAVELRELLLRIRPGGIADVIVAGVSLRPYPDRIARARVTTSTRRAPARRNAVAHAPAVAPVV
jgi:hypothetical protein